MRLNRSYILLLPILALLASSCHTTKIVEHVPVYFHDTIHTVQTLHDSTFIDRWHTVHTLGDTVYIHDSFSVVKQHLLVDTIYRYIERPVTVTLTETVEVEKPLRFWQRGLMWAGITGIFSLALWLVLRLRHRISINP